MRVCRLKTVVAMGFGIVLLTVKTADGVGDSSSSRQTMKGLPGVAVVAVDCNSGGLPRYVVKTDVELQLRQAGIKVLDTEQASATLQVRLICYRLPQPALGHSYTLDLRLLQYILWPPAPTHAVRVVTWSSLTYTGTSAICMGECDRWTGDANLEFLRRSTIRDMVNEFINAWLSVNPSR